MIFTLKNPGALNDDFWNNFINIWIYLLAVLAQVIYIASPGYFDFVNSTFSFIFSSFKIYKIANTIKFLELKSFKSIVLTLLVLL